jgi:hypothetical protein
MKYAFIQRHRQEFRVTQLCYLLQVSRSGFYAWQHRAESRRARQNRDLVARMHVLHQATREAYGARKMCKGDRFLILHNPCFLYFLFASLLPRA